jgi:anti-anti-sigma factor
MNAGGNCVILDIEHLTYMDSTGLSLLVVAHKRMKAAGGSFSVLAPTHIVKRLFDVAAGVPFRVVHGAAV